MVNVKKSVAIVCTATFPMVASAATVTIDTFDTAQQALDPSGFGIQSTDTIAAAEALGGMRTITANGNGPTFPSLVTAVNVQGGAGSVSNGDQVTGTGLFEWAAGGFDLTDGGTNDTFVLQINSVDLNVGFELTVDGSSASSAFNSNTGNVEFSFGAFGDLTSANDIALLVSGPEAFDASFSFFGAEDLIENPVVATVPLPAGGLLLGSVLLGAGYVARRKA